MKARGRPKDDVLWDRTTQLYWELRQVDPKVTAVEVHRRYKIIYQDDYPAESTVRKIVQHEKKRSDEEGKVILDQVWKPWRTRSGKYSESLISDSEHGSEMPYLALLGLVKEATLGESLLMRESKWAIRLRSSMEGLDPYLQLTLIISYSDEEKSALERGYEPNHEFLDRIVTVKPWLVDRHQIWRSLMDSSIIAQPTDFLGTPSVPVSLDHQFGKDDRIALGLDEKSPTSVSFDWQSIVEARVVKASKFGHSLVESVQEESEDTYQETH